MVKKNKFRSKFITFGISLSMATAASQAGESDGDLSVIYTCDGNRQIAVRYINKDDQANVVISWNGRNSTLVQVRAASGAKYGDDHLTWWEKGGTGLLMQNEEIVERNCKVQS